MPDDAKHSIWQRLVRHWLGLGAILGVALALIAFATSPDLRALIFMGQVRFEPIDFNDSYSEKPGHAGKGFHGTVSVTNYRRRSIKLANAQFFDRDGASVVTRSGRHSFICFFLDEPLIRSGVTKELSCRSGALNDEGSFFSPYHYMVRDTCSMTVEITGSYTDRLAVPIKWVTDTDC